MTTLRFFISRDSAKGVLADHCDVWSLKPRREHNRVIDAVVWLGGSAAPGHMGQHTVEKTRKNFGTVPDADNMLVVCEQNALPEPVVPPPTTDSVKPVTRRRRTK